MFVCKEMEIAPALAAQRVVAPPQPRYALLINPFYPKDPYSSYGKHVLTPALSLTSIASATPPEWEVRYWDENLLQGPPPVEPLPSVVGITVHLTFAKRAFRLADWYRQKGAKVVLGGLHVQTCPDECKPHADALAIGEGTQLWPRILRDAERSDTGEGNLEAVYRASYENSFEDEPRIRRDILQTGGFLTGASLIATRGCRNRCNFCYLSTEKLRLPYRTRDMRSVAEEFVATGEPYGVFLDNNLGSNPEVLRNLCRALKPAEKIWSAAVTVDIAKDPHLVRKMAEAGCTGVFIDFESLHPENLSDARKGSPHPGEYAAMVELFHQVGIQVNGSFVLGFDRDGPGVFENTVRWIEANRLECATFHILTPYPGTPFFRKLEAEGRILHRDWDLYDTFHVVFQPKRLAPKELEEGYRWCYKRLFSSRSIWCRRPRRVSDIPSYLGMSYLYKRANFLWPFLIRHRLTHAVWHPLTELARRRHLRHRQRLGSAELSFPQTLPLRPGV